ncbi:hypothetical protein M9H77_19991 [Catharanthus roseus]|uniref:Uncharacterized protein n=1 Tax=Catharanthus roseus TaxID=4058 RepID=A0ACC0AML6_CATRO|nr:hypothetical protein M9H77_19991 [Catharanthus roseus]
MEMFFKDCPHPSENQRKELAIQLGLDHLKINFLFQNKQTQRPNQCDCPHPSENQRKELGIQLGLDHLRINFLFQNKQTQRPNQCIYSVNDFINTPLPTPNKFPIKQLQEVVVMGQANNNLINNQNVVSEGEQLVDDTTLRKRKNKHRHTPEQIQRMEMFFKDCPHPSENQRKELGIQLGLDHLKINFLFQNKQTQRPNQCAN